MTTRELSPPRSTAEVPCRLCRGPSVEQFSLTLLKKYPVSFYRCSTCRSLQTATPFWLDEAYGDQRRFFDTGAVIRNQTLIVQLWYIKKLFGFHQNVTALDWGGGDGLFTRLMRDIGINAYHYDKFATNTYAAGFDDSPDRSYDIITAFEVWEHLPEPEQTIDDIFSRKPEVHFLTTGLYTGQGPDWGYIWPTTGRHVFFFSAEAMKMIAKKYGYSVLASRTTTIFFKRELSPLRKKALSLVLSGRWHRLFQIVFLLSRSRGLADRDRRDMQQRFA